MPPSVDILSLRSSCERCRFQKLKCTVPLDSSRCVRCCRAKVDCKFSRRTKGRRHELFREKDRNRGKDQEGPRGVEEGDGNVGLGVPSPSPSPSKADISTLNMNSAGIIGLGMDLGLEVELEQTQDGDGLPATIQALLDLDESWPQPLDAGIDEFDDFSTIRSWMDIQDAGVKWMTAEDSRNNVLSGETQTPTIYLRYRRSDEASDPVLGSEMGGVAVHTGGSMPVSLLQLSRLAGRIHDTINTLDHGRWTTIRYFTQLEEYPIGSILSLCRELSSVARGMGKSNPPLPRDQCQAPASFPIFNYVPLGSDSGTIALAYGDEEQCTPTRLLVLSCYLSLSALFEIVLSHFKTPLSQQGDGLVAGQSEMGLGCGLDDVTGKPEVRLGELPRANDMWSRLWMAIYLLMRAFRSIEDAIWPASDDATREARRPPTAAERQSIGDDRADELGYVGELTHGALKSRRSQKVQELKHLLQLKMNL
ncbi:hypothetical protein BJY04DRAFT_219023 [Aspergillus karnatakaensis]|uniref:Zn(II)2Cys6 transcription factor domain-containing protein n=1 Tax=Aspergillus karnatakaensis TaxID=1810916 RepID=UPI003CCCF514